MSVGSLIGRGLNLGIDFTGGTLMEFTYEQEVDLNPIRKLLGEAGFPDAIVQHYGSLRDLLIQLPVDKDSQIEEISERVLTSLRQKDATVDLRRVEFVGPQVGEDLTTDGILAMLYATVGILIYIGLRFQFRFAVGAIAALVHDVVITAGFFSVTGAEFNLTVLAAIMAIIGYSLNDTMVIYDHIRENFRRSRKDSPREIINTSLNRTLSRTLITSSTTLLVVLALFFLGGEVIHNFALALIFGILIGTYSSLYVASPILLLTGVSREDLLLPEKEGV